MIFSNIKYDTTPQEDKRVHYPHLLAPPSLRTASLPSSRPSRFLNPVLWTFATLGNKEKEQQLREYMWKTELPCNPTRTLTPDSVTDYEYDYDNRLVEVSLPTNSDTVEYTYDAMGRRLTKKFTYHNGANTDVTTYKYHYIGGQITEIEIDSIRNPGEGQTVLRNEEVKIHLGANSQPISYEWVKHVGESTTSATYYYHYDIHGNVLKVTDSSENVKITYTYDVLGKILTETNPDSVLNFFTFRGASQTIWDSEVGMYYSGGYYRPDTGTALQGTGAPVLTNPATGAMISAMAQVNQINRQMAIQARRAVKTAGATGGYTQGSSSGGTPGGFRPPAGPSDGVAHSGKNKPSRPPDPTPPPIDCSKLGKLRVRKGGGLRTFEAISSDPMNPVKPGSTVIFDEPLDDESEGDGSGISYAIAITPITEEVDASQLQPEQSDETFEAVYVWETSGEQGSSQAVNTIDTGLPGGGGEIRVMNPILNPLLDLIGKGLYWLYILLGGALVLAGINFEKTDTYYGILHRYFKDLPQEYRDYLSAKQGQFGLGGTGMRVLIETAKAQGKNLRASGWKLTEAGRKKFFDDHVRGDISEDSYKKLSDNEVFDLIMIMAMAKYDSKYGPGAAAKDPKKFRDWLHSSPEAQEWRDYLQIPGPPPKPGSVGSGDYPIEIQPKPIVPPVTTTSYYRIREIHKEKVQV